jgi:hypothetical protein
MVKYDLLVYLGFIPVFATIIVAAFVIWATPVDVDPEVRKIRVADATLVGLLALFVFTASLYYNDPGGAGQEIFDKAYPTIFALAGIIIGYIFTRKN